MEKGKYLTPEMQESIEELIEVSLLKSVFILKFKEDPNDLEAFEDCVIDFVSETENSTMLVEQVLVHIIPVSDEILEKLKDKEFYWEIINQGREWAEPNRLSLNSIYTQPIEKSVTLIFSIGRNYEPVVVVKTAQDAHDLISDIEKGIFNVNATLVAAALQGSDAMKDSIIDQLREIKLQIAQLEENVSEVYPAGGAKKVPGHETIVEKPPIRAGYYQCTLKDRNGKKIETMQTKFKDDEYAIAAFRAANIPVKATDVIHWDE